jgi:hypothetical protein
MLDDYSNSNNTVLLITDRHAYTKYGTKRLWTNEWIQYVRKQSQQHRTVSPSSKQLPVVSTISASTTKDVVAHIRRGDVSLCNPNTYDRYLPNSYYRTLLQQYVYPTITANDDTKTIIMTIFSEYNSTESWSDFVHNTTSATINYIYKFNDVPLQDVWDAIINADIVLLSTSTFSLIPAIFNIYGTIIYTPFWIQVPQSLQQQQVGSNNWIVVDDDMIRNMRRTKIRLRNELCQQ